MKITQLLYLPVWFLKAKIFGKKNPLQSVIFITDQCNLRCKHCNIVNAENPVSKSFEEIKEELKYCYQSGSRFVDFEGGEPLLWKDHDKNINDLITLAKEIGFFSTTVTTNAQLPFHDCLADSIWVSMDGLGDFHDSVRGKGSFERLEKNMAESNHKELSVNMVINTLNYENVEDAIRYVSEKKYIKSISLNFHTPYPGIEDLFLPWEKREEVIELIIKMKRNGFPIMNSVSGLKLMKNNQFKKVCWVTNFIMTDGTRLPECAGKSYDICDQCGLCMAGEMRSVMSFKPDTLWAGMKLRLASGFSK